MEEESLTHEQFLAWTLSNNTSPSIQYILKHRVVKGEVQYLVRYTDTNNFPYDTWISSSRITSMQLIIAYINKQNPPDLKPNIAPNEQTPESDDEPMEIHIKHAKAQSEQKIQILELIDDNHFKVIYPGRTKIEDATRDELEKNYKEEYYQFYDNFLSNLLEQVSSKKSSSKETDEIIALLSKENNFSKK